MKLNTPLNYANREVKMLSLDEKEYQNFTIKERINLTIAALSRNDAEEVSRLRRTCQRKQYTMLDREYSSRLDNLLWVAVHFIELNNSYYNRMIIFMFHLATHDADDNFEKFYLAYIDQVAHIKSLFEALYSFCNDVGLNKDHLMEWLKINPKAMSNLIGEKMMQSVEPDNDFILEIKKQFLALWNDNFSEFI